jgi:hypothetical protein
MPAAKWFGDLSSSRLSQHIIYAIRTPHQDSTLILATYNGLRIQLLSDFANVGAMFITGTTPGNAFRCYHKHQTHYRESSSFPRLPNLLEVAAFWLETG